MLPNQQFKEGWTRCAATLLCAVLIGLATTVQAQDVVVTFDGDAKPGELYLRDGAALPSYVVGRHGQAILFGQGAVVAMPLDIDARRHPQLTVSLWIRAGADAATQAWLFGPGDGNNQPFLRIFAGRHVGVEGRYADGERSLLQSDTVLPVDEWVPVAAVWDYDSRSIRLHVGAEVEPFENLDMDVSTGHVGAQRLQIPPNAPAGTEAKPYVFIGARQFRYAYPAEGYAIDDVRIFMRALSPNEVSAQFAETGSVLTAALRVEQEPAVSIADQASCTAHSECPVAFYCAVDGECYPDSQRPIDDLVASSAETTIADGQDGRSASTNSSGSTSAATTGSLTLSWSLVDSNGESLSCAESSAALVSVLATSTSNGMPHETLLDCNDLAGSSGGLPLGDYTVSVSLLGAGSGDAIVQVRPVDAILTVASPTVDMGPFTFRTARAPSASGSGQFSVAWSIVDTDGNTLSCTAANADRVSILATQVATGIPYEKVLACNAGVAVTDPLPLGQYMISVALLEVASADSLTAAAPLQATLTVDGSTEEVGPVILPTAIGIPSPEAPVPQEAAEPSGLVACDAVNQQGCGPGEKCGPVRVDDAGQTVMACTADGTVNRGGVCALSSVIGGSDDCVGGTFCDAGICAEITQ
jgi:hypothetical protein